MDTVWQSSPLARQLIQTEAILLEAAMADVFGLEMLQLGRWGARHQLLAGNRIRHQTVLASQVAADVDIVARLAHLPVQSSAIDAVLLPHVLEYESDPHAVLREADRVLVGEGQLLILGFQPAGPWGWRAAASRSGFPPGSRRLLSEQRLRDWLGLLRYEIVAVQRYLYRWPFETKTVPDAATAGQRGLKRGWVYPWPAGAYLLRARKRVYSATPLRARRRERRAVLGGAWEPST